MNKYLSILGVLVFCGFLAVTVAAQGEGPALPDDGLTLEDLVEAVEEGDLDDVRRKGLLVFTTPFNTFDGHGDGPFANEFPPTLPGNRPTLQGNGQFLFLNGLESQSCNECHSLVSSSTRPPTLGLGGAGTAVQNAIILPSMIDVADSYDDRVAWAPDHDPDLPLLWDGVADYNGRISNPPFLYGGGGVELLAKEMTADLQELRQEAQANPGTPVPLVTHGVNFGEITFDNPDFDLSGVEGISGDLVVRPFGRKGEAFSMRDFDRGAMQFHFGMQPVEVVGHEDGDLDGVVDEVTVAEMSALHIFEVTNPRPRAKRLLRGSDARAGFRTFNRIGCATCHIPVMETRSRFLPLAHPEVAEDPSLNVYLEIDLVEVGFDPAPGGGVLVPLFADLKRHDMGLGLAENFEIGVIPDEDFTTARLWGIWDTAPYLHDGRATVLSHAILAHGGEAQGPRDAFANLSSRQQQRLLSFLGTLRTPKYPNEDLLEDDHGPPYR